MNFWNLCSAGIAREAVKNWPTDSMPVRTYQNKYMAMVRLCSTNAGVLTGGVVVSVTYHANPQNTHHHKDITSTRRLARGTSERSILHAIARCYTECRDEARVSAHREALYRRGQSLLPDGVFAAHAKANHLPMAYVDMTIEHCDKWNEFINISLDS
jgi:hypothetical protein